MEGRLIALYSLVVLNLTSSKCGYVRLGCTKPLSPWCTHRQGHVMHTYVKHKIHTAMWVVAQTYTGSTWINAHVNECYTQAHTQTHTQLLNQPPNVNLQSRVIHRRHRAVLRCHRTENLNQTWALSVRCSPFFPPQNQIKWEQLGVVVERVTGLKQEQRLHRKQD